MTNAMQITYHQHDLTPLPCVIAIDHGDGTFSLAREHGGEVFVRCALTAEPQPGFATVQFKPAPAPDQTAN